MPLAVRRVHAIQTELGPAVDATNGEWRRLFLSSGRDAQPIVSPDGEQLVFTSDRAGRFELWWARLDAPDSLRPIERVRPDTRQPPAWSVDGSHLLVTALDDANAPMILEIEPVSGSVERLDLPSAHPAQAAYGPPGTLYVVEGDEADGGTSLVAYDRHTWRVQGRIKDASQVRFDPVNGRVLYSRLDANGLWSVSPSLGAASIVRLSETVPSRWRYRSWSLTTDAKLVYLDATPACRSRVVQHDAKLDRLEATGHECVDPAVYGATNGFSSAGSVWYIALATEDDSDIGFMPAPGSEPESGFVPKWLILLRDMVS